MEKTRLLLCHARRCPDVESSCVRACWRLPPRSTTTTLLLSLVTAPSGRSARRAASAPCTLCLACPAAIFIHLPTHAHHSPQSARRGRDGGAARRAPAPISHKRTKRGWLGRCSVSFSASAPSPMCRRAAAPPRLLTRKRQLATPDGHHHHRRLITPAHGHVWVHVLENADRVPLST